MNYVIPQPLAQSITDYLVLHPYREVAHFIAALQQLQRLPEPTDKDEDKRPAA